MEVLKPSGHRLGEKHRQIIRKYGRRWNKAEGAALRELIENYDRLFKK